MTNTMSTESREQRVQQMERAWAERRRREEERTAALMGTVGSGRRV